MKRDDILLAWEMNGQPLKKDHGAPLRLIVPGWFGIAWVKWLSRIEVLDRRYMSKFMARAYLNTPRGGKKGKSISLQTNGRPFAKETHPARWQQLHNGANPAYADDCK